MLGHLISDEEIHHRPFRRGVEVDRLIHVVEGRMVTRHQPLLDHFQAVDLWVRGVHAVRYVNGGTPCKTNEY